MISIPIDSCCQIRDWKQSLETLEKRLRIIISPLRVLNAKSKYSIHPYRDCVINIYGKFIVFKNNYVERYTYHSFSLVKRVRHFILTEYIKRLTQCENVHATLTLPKKV